MEEEYNDLERIDWRTTYGLWKEGELYLPNSLSKPITAKPVFVEYNNEGCIYGYDWLENENAEERIKIVSERPTQFLLFTEPSNKGTIQTAQMLAEAKDEEERAAIWIAATTFELKNLNLKNGINGFASKLHSSAVSFLLDRYYLWHHAMRKLVPEIMIPYSVLDSIQCSQIETVMGLVQTNVMLLEGAYTVLRYSSLSDTEIEKEGVVKKLSQRR